MPEESAWEIEAQLQAASKQLDWAPDSQPCEYYTGYLEIAYVPAPTPGGRGHR